MEMASQQIMQQNFIDGLLRYAKCQIFDSQNEVSVFLKILLFREKRENLGFKIYSMLFLVWEISNMSILIRYLRQNPIFSHFSLF